MTIFEKNITLIDRKYPYVSELVKQVDLNEAGKKVGIEQTTDGQLILFKTVNNRKWYLNSRLNPEMASKLYADRYKIQPYEMYFVFGFADGRSIKKLLEKCDATNLLVVGIPDMEAFAVAISCFDFCNLWEDDRVKLVFPEIVFDTETFIQYAVDYTRIKLLEFCILPGYDILYHEMCEQYMDIVLDRMKNVIVNKSTQLSFNRLVPQRILSNTKRMIMHSNIRQLQMALKNYDLRNIPAIIVSAGPSLDQNIHLLKEARGRALIIAVDASVRAVMQAGVRPDLLCSIDPKSPERFLTDVNLDDVYWACNQMSNSLLLKKYGKHIFYYGSYRSIWENELEKQLGYEFPKIATGGSVSTEAFMLSLYLGFRTIILIGQDLAFTGGVSHTKGIGNALGDNDAYIKKRHLVEVEGIDGTMLQTDFQMWFYKQWFEKMIRINQNRIRVIDATEGGARIEGTELMTLREAIDIYCTQNLDLYNIEQKIPPMFSKEQQKKIRERLKEIEVDIVELKKEIEDTIVEQEKIYAEIKESTNSEMVADQLHKLVEMNQKIDVEKSPVLDYITMYATNEEYEVGEDIYAVEDLKPEQLVEKSLTLLKGYQKGAKLFMEDFENIILKDED